MLSPGRSATTREEWLLCGMLADEQMIPNSSGDDTEETAMSADWDDALLFEVAVDPFQKIAISGREEGRIAGLRDGYLEGMNIGRSKGWEIGLELGYINNFARGILDGYKKKSPDCKHEHQPSSLNTVSSQSIQQTPPKLEQRTSHRLVRCLTLAQDLVDLIDKFPDPDLLLSQNEVEDTNEDTYDVEKSMNNKESNVKACCNNTDSGCNSKPHMHSQSEEKDNKARNHEKSNPYPKQQPMLDVTTAIERIRSKFKLLCVLLKTKQSFDLKSVLESGDAGKEDGQEGISTDIKSINENEEIDSTKETTKIRGIDISGGKDGGVRGSDW